MQGFYGNVPISETALIPIQAVSSSVPINADAAPRFVVYHAGTGSIVTAVSGQASQAHTGSVTNVVNDGGGECRVTSASHGLETGARVTITGVNGATGINGTHNITKIDANTFDCDGSTFGGTYTNGGTWNFSGYYNCSIAFTTGNGFAQGQRYIVKQFWLISASARDEEAIVQVV
jgi:hypothetical protein